MNNNERPSRTPKNPDYWKHYVRSGQPQVAAAPKRRAPASAPTLTVTELVAVESRASDPPTPAKTTSLKRKASEFENVGIQSFGMEEEDPNEPGPSSRIPRVGDVMDSEESDASEEEEKEVEQKAPAKKKAKNVVEQFEKRMTRYQVTRKPDDEIIAKFFKDRKIDINDETLFQCRFLFQKLLREMRELQNEEKENLVMTGSPLFIKVFRRGEHLFKSDARRIRVHTVADGHEFEAKKGDFQDVFLVKNVDGLDIKIPKDLCFENLAQYIDIKKEVTANNSFRSWENGKDIPIAKILELMEKKDRTVAWNVLSLEFENANFVLHEKFEVPAFVRDHSITVMLKNALKRKIKILEKKIAGEKNATTKGNLEKKLAQMERQFKDMPKYHKFLLVSMEGSFTDIHVDFSASSVYYHVIEGQKIFYVAPPTTDNLLAYQRYEEAKIKEREGRPWLGDQLFKDFSRVVINPGETAMIPSGWIHYVYTPMDSLVIGGNYLMEQYLERQFELTKTEEISRANRTIYKSNTYDGFYNVMWAYMEHMVIDELKTEDLPEAKRIDLMKKAEILLKGKNMDPEAIILKDWYNKEECRALRKELSVMVEDFKHPATEEEKEHMKEVAVRVAAEEVVRIRVEKEDRKKKAAAAKKKNKK